MPPEIFFLVSPHTGEHLFGHRLDPPVLKQRRRFLEYAGTESFCRLARVLKPNIFPPMYFMESKK